MATQLLSKQLLPKMPYPLATTITSRYDLPKDVQPLLDPALTPEQFIEKLDTENLPQDCITFIAHGLPPREAIAWALQCCRQSQIKQEASNKKAALNEQEQQALAIARAWYRTPDEDHRRAAEKAAQAAQLQTPPGWVAQAVFWSSGSMTPPDTPVVPPPPFLYSKAIAGAITLAAVLPDGSQAETLFPLFIERGMAIAQGEMPEQP